MAAVMFRLQKSAAVCSQPVFHQYLPGRFSSSSVIEVTEEERKFPKVKSDIATLKKGTGGRSSFSGKIVTVFGGTGFLGRAVVNQLGKAGNQVIIPYRTDHYNCRQLKLCGDLGQILFTHFFLKDEESLYKAIKHSHIVINMIGRDYETPNFNFQDVHVTGARNIARISKELGVETLLHVSALNACEKPTPYVLKKGSGFYKSKWEGENVVREEFPEAIIFRPSDIWGMQDHFINYYLKNMRRTWRFMSLWNRGVGTIKQPVFHSDVAKGIVNAINDPTAQGHIFQAVGPHRYELSEMMDWWHRVLQRTRENHYHRLDIRLDFTYWMRLMFAEIAFSRYRLISWERLEREVQTDIVYPELPNLEDLGVELTTMEQRVFYELQLYRLHAYSDPLLENYIRPVEPCPIANA